MKITNILDYESLELYGILYVRICVCHVIQLVAIDVHLLLASSANAEWQTVILQNWAEHWNVVCRFAV